MRIVLLLILLLINSAVIISGEYYINDGITSTYLFASFNDVKEEIFPQNIRIRLSLNKIAGTLLYSIDRHMNQLIIQLDRGMTLNLVVQFRNQTSYLSIQELCGCSVCRYQMLDFLITIKNFVNIRCNNGDIKEIKYELSTTLNEDFPIPFKSTRRRRTSKNEAYLWLVNTPEYKDLHPNPNQLSGCIFLVSYMNHPIKFTNMSGSIENKCVKICDSNICNGGQCHETYNKAPVCDCTYTFLNGLYCNDTFGSINRRSKDRFFEFDMIKVSWLYSEGEIITFKNSMVQVQINCLDRAVYLEYTLNGDHIIFTRASITQNYVSNTESILLAYFNDTSIDIKFYNNGSWSNSVLTINRKLKDEIFNSLTIKSGEGDIDVAYMKLPMNYVWKRINISQYENIKIDLGTSIAMAYTSILKDSTLISIPVIIAIVVGALLVLVIVLSILVITRIRRRSKLGEYKNVSQISIPSDSIPPHAELLAQQKCQEAKACIKWKRHEYGSTVPHNVLEAAKGLYIIRSKFCRDWTIGNVRSDDQYGYVSYNRLGVPTSQYEILCYSANGGYGETIEWINDSNGHVPDTAIIGGYTESYEPLYIAKYVAADVVCVGKVQRSHKCAYVPCNGTEMMLYNYEVLCHK